MSQEKKSGRAPGAPVAGPGSETKRERRHYTSSKKSAAANRRNGKKGGPKTPAGKAKSSQNSLFHGLSSSFGRILSTEDPKEFEVMRKDYYALYDPKNVADARLVDVMVDSMWKLHRAGKYETWIFEEDLLEHYRKTLISEKSEMLEVKPGEVEFEFSDSQLASFSIKPKYKEYGSKEEDRATLIDIASGKAWLSGPLRQKLISDGEGATEEEGRELRLEDLTIRIMAAKRLLAGREGVLARTFVRRSMEDIWAKLNHYESGLMRKYSWARIQLKGSVKDSES